MADQVKGLTIKLDADGSAVTSSFSSIKKEGIQLSKYIAEINKELKFDGANTETLEKKFDALTDVIKNTEGRVEYLNAELQALEEEDGGTGQLSDKIAKVKTEISKTESILDSYKGQLSEIETESQRAFLVDTSKVKQEISEVSSETKDLEQYLKQVETALKLDPSNLENVEKQFETLNSVVASTENKLSLYEKQLQLLEQQDAGTGKFSKEMSSLQTDILKTKNSLSDYQNQLNSIDTSKSEQAIKGLSDETKQLDSYLKEIDKALELDPGNVDLIETKFESVNSAISKTEQTLTEYKSQLERLEQEDGGTGKFEQDILGVRTSILQTENTLKGYQEELDTTGQASESAFDFGDIDISGLSGITGGLDGVMGSISGVVGAIPGIGGAMSTMASALAGPVGIAVGTIALIGKALIDVQDEADQTSGKLEASLGVSEDLADNLGELARKIYIEVPNAEMEDVEDTLIVVNQLMDDLDESEMQNVTENALALQDAFDFDPSESVRSAQQLMTNFGITSEQAFDLMTTGAQNGLNKNQDLLDVINEFAPDFESLGYSADEMFAILEKGSDNGAYSIDKFADSFQEVQVKLDEMSDDTRDAFESMGLDADEYSKRVSAGGEDGADALNEIISALGDIEDPQEQAIAGANIFGTQFEDVGIQAYEGLGEVNNAFSDVEGATKDAGDALENNFTSKFESLKRTATENLKEIALDFIEFDFESLSNRFDEFMGSVKKLFTSIPEKIGSFLAEINPEDLVDGLGDLIEFGLKTVFFNLNLAKSIVTGLADGIANTDWGAVTTNLFDAFKVALENFIINATEYIPTKITSVAQSITQGITDFFTTDTSSEENGKAMIDKMSTGAEETANAIDWGELLSQMFTAIWTAFKDAGSQIVDALKEGISNKWEEFKQSFADRWAELETEWEELKQSFVDFGKDIINSIKEGLSNTWNSIKTWFSEKWNGLLGWFSSLPSRFSQKGQDIINGILSGLKAKWSGLKTWFSDSMSSLADTFKPSNWIQVGKDIVSGIITGITGAASGLFDSLTSLASNALDSAKDFLDINSPSRVFRDEVGKWIPEGIAVGVDANTSGLDSSIEDMANNSVKVAQDTLKTDIGSIQSGYSANAMPTTSSITNSTSNVDRSININQSGVITNEQFIDEIVRQISKTQIKQSLQDL